VVREMRVAIAGHRGRRRQRQNLSDEIVELPVGVASIVSGVVHQPAQSIDPRANDDDGERIDQRVPPGLADPDRSRDQAIFKQGCRGELDAVDLRKVADFFLGEQARNVAQAGIAQFR